MSAELPRLLIIGNSHIAAPRLAYIGAPERWPGWDIDFLGLPGGLFGRLELHGGVLVPPNESAAQEMLRYNLVRRLDVSGYDAFATIGGFGWLGAALMTDQHRSLDFPSVRAGDGRAQLVSRSFLAHALRTRLRMSAAGRALRLLEPLGRPVVMLPEPLPSAGCEAAPDRYGAYLAMAARGDARFWMTRFRVTAGGQFAQSAALRLWPKEAIHDGCFTRPDLMRGAPKLAAGAGLTQPETDFAHGNADYGALVMDQIMAALPSA